MKKIATALLMQSTVKYMYSKFIIAKLYTIKLIQYFLDYSQ